MEEKDIEIREKHTLYKIKAKLCEEEFNFNIIPLEVYKIDEYYINKKKDFRINYRQINLAKIIECNIQKAIITAETIVYSGNIVAGKEELMRKIINELYYYNHTMNNLNKALNNQRTNYRSKLSI